jgi:transmembrane sensor
MSNPLTRARQLIPRRFDGLATEAEIAELDRLLAEHPEAADALAHAANLESNLELLIGDEAGSQVSGDEGGEVVSIASAGHLTGSSRAPVARRGKRVALATLGVAAAAALVWSLRPATDRPIQVSRTDLGSERANLMRFADGSTAELKGTDSRIEARAITPEAIELTLVSGSARFDVVPRASRQFRIWVGAMRVEVVGTVFSVERLATSARVSVERGSVRVVSGDSTTLLSPGAAEVIPLADAPVASPPPPATPAPVRAEAKHRGKRDEPGELLAAAESARREERLDDAIGLLRRIVDQHPRDPRAPYAAFILGRVLLDELGHPREAAAAFARVGTLDPRTPLLPDALAREVESWSRAGDPARAETRGREYLSRYPDGRRVREVRRYSRIE